MTPRKIQSQSEEPDIMKFYTFMSHLPAPKSYLGKILVISFFGVHVPMIGAVIYVLSAVDITLQDMLGVLIALLVATLIGTVATFIALIMLLAPVRQASIALDRYLEEGEIPTLPVTFKDQAGGLMANVQKAVTHLDLLLDSAVAQRNEAMASHKQKFALLANLSHDVRTPLNHVIGFAEMMSTEALGPLGSGTYKSYAQNIGSSGGELLHLLQSVLTLSEAESGKHEADIHPLNLHQALTRALHLLHENAENSDTNVAFEAPEREGVLVMSDERTLKQILLHSFQIVQAGPGNQVTATLEENRPDGTAVLTISSSAQWHSDDLPPELKINDDSADTGIPGESSSPTALRIAMIRSMATVIGSTVNVDKTREGNGRRITMLLPLAPEGTMILDSQRSSKFGNTSPKANLRQTG
tara:strand:+ start:2057 stop:3295 length:1239 start_codon:yes stop_codon:yes gene_type:complete